MSANSYTHRRKDRGAVIINKYEGTYSYSPSSVISTEKTIDQSKSHLDPERAEWAEWAANHSGFG